MWQEINTLSRILIEDREDDRGSWTEEKIIRDRIWEKIYIEEPDKIRIITQDTKEKIYFLTVKLAEEFGELIEAIWKQEKESIYEEAGDLLEVFDSLIKEDRKNTQYIQEKRGNYIEWLMKQGFDMPSIINAQEVKRRERGSFYTGYILKM
jgi:NTP pyrophosphatase (non-canonical NTP hydrolase)